MIDNEIGTIISGQKADGIISTGDVHLTASNDPDITAVAGSVGVSTKGLGVGLSVAYNEIDDTVSASVYGTDIYVIDGNLILDAEQTSVIISIAAGGGFANKRPARARLPPIPFTRPPALLSTAWWTSPRTAA